MVIPHGDVVAEEAAVAVDSVTLAEAEEDTTIAPLEVDSVTVEEEEDSATPAAAEVDTINPAAAEAPTVNPGGDAVVPAAREEQWAVVHRHPVAESVLV